ncbi:PP2C family protein-serine/threonine phosphatase [Desulforhopalus sp. 52FAK]
MDITRDDTKTDALLQRRHSLGAKPRAIKTFNKTRGTLLAKMSPLPRDFGISTLQNESDHERQLAETIIDNSKVILFRRLASGTPEQRKMVYVSPNISRFGYEAEDFLSGKTMYRDLVFPGDSERTLKEIEDFVAQGIENYTQVYRIITRTGEVRWVEDRTSIFRDPASGVHYHQGIVIDIHDQKTIEEKLRKSEEKYRRIVETASEGFLLMDKSFNVIDHNSAYADILGRPGADLTYMRPLGMEPARLKQLWRAGRRSDVHPERREIEYDLTLLDGRIVPLLIHANTLRSDKGKIIGSMAFVTDISTQKKALLLAAEVQRGLFPASAPKVEGLEVAGRSYPCDEVGGDYYDYLAGGIVESESLIVVIGDIIGHGVDSALLMASARAFLRMRVSQAGTIEEVIRDMNQQLAGDMEKSGRFMTMLLLNFGKDGRSVEWVRAGHDPALLYDPTRQLFSELKGPGLALGIEPTYEYQSQTKGNLQPGQLIILTTDGIFEGTNQEGEMYGAERLKNIVRRNSGESAEAVLDHIINDHSIFTGGIAREDDATLVVVKII